MGTTLKTCVMQNDQKIEVELLNELVDSIQEGITVLNKELRIEKANKWVRKKIYAPSQKHIIGHYCYKTYKNRETPCPHCPVLDTFKTGESKKEVLKDPFSENKDCVYEITTYPIYGEDGEVEKVIESYNDITHLIKYEAELAERQEKYKALYNNAPLAYQSLNIEGHIIDVNPAWLKTLGYEREEVIGKWFGDFLHPDYVVHFRENFPLFKKKGFISDVQFSMVKKDQSIIYVSFEGCIGYWPDGQFKQTYCTFKEITRQHKTEVELREYKNKLESIFLVAPTGIGQVENRVITDVNNRIVEMTGYEADELIGKSALMIYPTQEDFDYVGKYKYDQISKYGTGSVETRWKRKDGKIIDVLLASTPVDINDVSKGTIFTALDISDRKKYERQLRKRNEEYEKINEQLRNNNEELIIAKEKAEESNKLKSEFLNNMSHEVRTPMNGIMGFSEMLNNEGLSDEKRKFYCQIIQNSSRQLLRVIDDILEISTLETKQIKADEKSLSLNDLIRDLFAVFNLKAKECQISLYPRMQFKDDESYIITDSSKLIKILSNLLENAFKFTNKGYIEFGYFAEKNNLVFYVEDTGIGISPENQEMIFERFAQEDKEDTRTFEGLGLGLAISRENARLLGGDVTVESEKGKGSVFYVTIPYKPPLAQNSKKQVTDA